MRKSPRTNLQGLVPAAQSHNHASEQVSNDVNAQLRDDDVPEVLPDPQEAKSPAMKPAARSERSKGKQAAEADSKDYAHRSLYARPETLDLIRQIAFEKRTSAQALYREGLFLMLQEHGHYKDKTVDDV